MSHSSPIDRGCFPCKKCDETIVHYTSFKVFTVVWVRYKFFMDLMTDEEETTMLSQNVRYQISSDTAIQPRSTHTSTER